jgi:hypothetical protein
MDPLPINKIYNYDIVKHLTCNCGTRIPYSMMTVMSLFDIEYIECPYCNNSHVIDIEEFKRKENE